MAPPAVKGVVEGDNAEMKDQSLRKIGRRLISTGIVLAPINFAGVYAFWHFVGDTYGTLMLGLFALLLSVVLIGFGAAAIASAPGE